MTQTHIELAERLAAESAILAARTKVMNTQAETITVLHEALQMVVVLASSDMASAKERIAKMGSIARAAIAKAGGAA